MSRATTADFVDWSRAHKGANIFPAFLGTGKLTAVSIRPMPAIALPSGPSRQEVAWLSHLEILAELPYPGPMLVPAVVSAVRAGIDADFGAFGWVEGEHLRPVAFWSERMTEPVFRSFIAHLDVFFDEFPLRAHLESDGDAARLAQMMPGYEKHWHLTELLEPLGTRWATGVPIKGLDGACEGFLYLYRRADAGPYTDAEQAKLRRARDRLVGLHAAPTLGLAACPERPAARATLQFSLDGRMTARSANAIELLYLSHDARMGVLDWAAHNLSALPPSPRAMVEQLLVAPGVPPLAQCELVLAAGRLHFRGARLEPLDGGAPLVSVDIQHMEPIDLALARRLLDWPLSPQEKRLLLASTRQPGQQVLADALGITVGTLKAYVNRLQRRFDVSSRQALIERILGAPDPDRAHSIR